MLSKFLKQKIRSKRSKTSYWFKIAVADFKKEQPKTIKKKDNR